jgi:hypothetical protein
VDAHRIPVRTSEERETAMAAEFLLGAKASCSDGHCGEVRRTILDPVAMTVTHLVIQPGHHGELGRLVPVELADVTAGEIRLRCTLAEFGRLDPAEETDLEEGADYGGGYGSAASVQGSGNDGGMGVGGSASGMGIGMATGHRSSSATLFRWVRPKCLVTSMSTLWTARSGRWRVLPWTRPITG